MESLNEFLLWLGMCEVARLCSDAAEFEWFFNSYSIQVSLQKGLQFQGRTLEGERRGCPSKILGCNY